MVRVLSFQGAEVVKQLLTTGSYQPDLTKAREKRDYSEDVKQLNGEIPVWCFSSEYTKFNQDQFRSGGLFEIYKCEMSTEVMGGKILLEIEVPDDQPLLLGVTHRSYEYAYVFSNLTMDMVKAIYAITDFRDTFYVDVHLLASFADDILFPEGFSCGDMSSGEFEYIERGECVVNFKEIPLDTFVYKPLTQVELNKDYPAICTVRNGIVDGYARVRIGEGKKDEVATNINHTHIVEGTLKVVPNPHVRAKSYEQLRILFNTPNLPISYDLASSIPLAQSSIFG